MWLVCKKCGEKELIQDGPNFFVHCHACKGPHYAENDKGEPLIVWSTSQDLENWSKDPETGSKRFLKESH